MTFPADSERPASPKTVLHRLNKRWQAVTKDWERLRQLPMVPLLLLAATGTVLGLRSLGAFQLLELRAYDSFQQLRPTELPEHRVVIVGIGEDDLNWLNAATLTDQVMAEMLLRIKAQNPRIIGLDFYRNVPVEPGNEFLSDVFRTTPNLIGIEKVIADQQDVQLSSLPGNPILAEADQLAASDIAVDRDGRVRRGLLFPSATGDIPLEGLGFRLAIEYLAQEGIYPDDVNSGILSFGGQAFPPLNDSSGGYVGMDSGGYQILLNARKTGVAAEIVSLRSILTDSLPDSLMRDRIVVIGSTALSGADIFYTAHQHRERRDSGITFGVELHAELASQVISRVLDRRLGIRTLPNWGEALLILALSCSCLVLRRKEAPEWHSAVKLAIASGATVGLSYGLMMFQGLWLPVVPMLIAPWLAYVLTLFYRIVQLKSLSENDQLTRLPNRRTFDEALQREWFRAQRAKEPLGLILCDVDYFKRFNDTYGHLEGDDCLRAVAAAIRQMRRSSDMPARYGGEEFVVLLPQSNLEAALTVAEKIRARVEGMMRPHASSDVAECVTLSLGVSSIIPSMDIPMAELISQADQALYAAKDSGRNRVSCYGIDVLADDSEDYPMAA